MGAEIKHARPLLNINNKQNTQKQRTPEDSYILQIYNYTNRHQQKNKKTIFRHGKCHKYNKQHF
jgi:hypothetical protein